MYEGALPKTGAGVAVLGYELGATLLIALGISAVLLGVIGTRIATRMRRQTVANDAA
jgi:hypothetical protein